MKRKLLFITELFIFVCILAVMLCFANKLFMLKDGTGKYDDFYEEKSTFDILFFGSSKVLDGIQPMELWDDCGIRSYNMAQHAEGLGRDYWQLVNALRTQKPRLVVFDITYFSGNTYVDPDNKEDRAYLHKQIDHIPMSIDKIRTITHTSPADLWAEYLFPFILYHGRWGEIGLNNIKKNISITKGAETRTNIMPLEGFEWDEESRANIFNPSSVNLDKIIELCKEEGVDVLFICLPCKDNMGLMGSLNCFEDYFTENDVPFYFMAKDEDVFNFATDFADTSHVNVAGSMKVSDCIGGYFVKNYGVSKADSATKLRWDETLNEYKEQKDFRIHAYSNDVSYVLNMAYADNDYNVEFVPDKNGSLFPEISNYYPDVDTTEKYRIEVYRLGKSEPIVVK